MAQEVKVTQKPGAAGRRGAKKSSERSANAVDGKRGTRGVRVPGETTISSQNQVTVPVAALRQARLAAGDRVRVEVDSVGRIRISPLDMSPEEVVRRLADGALADLYPSDFVSELRDADWPDRW